MWAQEIVVSVSEKTPISEEFDGGLDWKEIILTPQPDPFKPGVENTPENLFQVTILHSWEDWRDQLLDLFFISKFLWLDSYLIPGDAFA